MKINENKYFVLTFVSKSGNLTFKEFLYPNRKPFKSLDTIIENNAQKGFEITDIKCCGREEYLNLKLDYIVDEYNEGYDVYDKTLEAMRNSEISMRVGIDTLECVYGNIDSARRRITTVVNRMVSQDYDIKNEQALMIRDMATVRREY